MKKLNLLKQLSMNKNVLITGGTGFVGKNLTALLLSHGFSVSLLSRNIPKETDGFSYFKWDVATNTIDENALLQANYIIHLAGENIGEKRWTPTHKKAILDSREQSTQLLYSALIKTNKKPEAFISASAVGIYGAYIDEITCTENTEPANDFLGTVCQKWESSTKPIANLGVRTVQIRTGLVLGKGEGVLKKIVPLFRLRLGSALGSGKQYMPWIHIDDLCEIYLHAIMNSEIRGAYNAAVNVNTTNTVFSKTLAKIFKYKIWLPNVPAFVLRLFLGERANLVVTGRKISSEKIQKTGFHFEFTDLETALRNCLSF